MNQVKYIHTSANACCSVSKNKNIVLPNKKENLAASPLSHPDSKAVEIVIPDLDTPGIIANA